MSCSLPRLPFVADIQPVRAVSNDNNYFGRRWIGAMGIASYRCPSYVLVHMQTQTDTNRHRHTDTRRKC
jgi:hypothetical protein